RRFLICCIAEFHSAGSAMFREVSIAEVCRLQICAAAECNSALQLRTWPSALRYSTLLEMFVPMSGQESHTLLVAEMDAFGGDNFANASQREFGKLFLPGIEQRNGIAGGDGKEQFKIFAIGQCGEQ